MIRRVVVIFILLMVGGAHVYLGMGPLRDFSPTYDEPVHLTAGYVYWKTGDTRYNGYHHPPLAEMWAAIPLLFMNPLIPKGHPAWLKQEWLPVDQYRFADRFLYSNRVSAEDLVAAGRKMQLLLSVLLGFFLCWVAWKIGGRGAAFLTLFFWGFSPTLLSSATIISTDLSFCFFFFAFFYLGSKYKESWLATTAAGVSLGFCLASKYLAIAIGPILIALYLWNKRRTLIKTIGPNKQLVIRGIVAGLIALVVLMGVYQGKGLDTFWEGLKAIVSRSQRGRSSFLWGAHSTTGWVTYFPFVFLVKTPVALTLALGVSVFRLWRKRFKLDPFLWIPPLLFFLIACFSKVQIGHRHILAIYPFLFIMAALGLAGLPKRFQWFTVLLLGWYGVSSITLRPHFIAYFNELISGPQNGYRYLTDSNIDWGQGLKALGKSLDPDDFKRGIYLSYFGTADPHDYGIRYIDRGSDNIAGHIDDAEDASLAPTKLAISVTNLQATYYANKDVFHWLLSYKPWKVVGHSIFVYDFAKDPDALKKLSVL
ncbi:MAG: hypothetical protein LHV69_01175 [Elusimicrobia bacterium]|nr:hypothetical protein [Candidatus Obscuribacterium magneticum]